MLDIGINQIIKMYIFNNILRRHMCFTYTYISHIYAHRTSVEMEKDVEIIGCAPNKISLIVLIVTSGWGIRHK